MAPKKKKKNSELSGFICYDQRSDPGNGLRQQEVPAQQQQQQQQKASYTPAGRYRQADRKTDRQTDGFTG